MEPRDLAVGHPERALGHHARVGRAYRVEDAGRAAADERRVGARRGLRPGHPQPGLGPHRRDPGRRRPGGLARRGGQDDARRRTHRGGGARRRGARTPRGRPRAAARRRGSRAPRRSSSSTSHQTTRWSARASRTRSLPSAPPPERDDAAPGAEQAEDRLLLALAEARLALALEDLGDRPAGGGLDLGVGVAGLEPEPLRDDLRRGALARRHEAGEDDRGPGGAPGATSAIRSRSV